LFRKLNRGFALVFAVVTVAVLVSAPWLMRVMAPGLAPPVFEAAVALLRILSLSTVAAGSAAIYSAMLYTHRPFGPAAFFEAAMNTCTIIIAIGFWKILGVYAFAVGYTIGACVQFCIVYFATRRDLADPAPPDCTLRWRDLLAKPAFFVVYAGALSLN